MSVFSWNKASGSQTKLYRVKEGTKLCKNRDYFGDESDQTVCMNYVQYKPSILIKRLCVRLKLTWKAESCDVSIFTKLSSLFRSVELRLTSWCFIPWKNRDHFGDESDHAVCVCAEYNTQLMHVHGVAMFQTVYCHDVNTYVAVLCRNRRLFRCVFWSHRCLQSAVLLNFW